MHIILGILGAIVTILIFIKRLSDAGIDIGWLDPFKWYRRKQWKQKYNTKPLYQLSDPMEATAGLMYAMVKESGEISLEEKTFLIETFKNDFHLSDKDATSLMTTCSFLITDSFLISNNLKKYLHPSMQYFSASQIESAMNLVEKAAYCGGEPAEAQIDFLNEIKNYISPESNEGKWK